MIMRKRPEKDTINPPGQITHVPTLEKSIQEWKDYEKSRNCKHHWSAMKNRTYKCRHCGAVKPY